MFHSRRMQAIVTVAFCGVALLTQGVVSAQGEALFAEPSASPAPPQGTCRMTQRCTSPNLDSGCHPVPVNSSEVFPRPFTGGFADVCTEYKDSACCSWQQRQALSNNFLLINATMGQLAGPSGCAACGFNLEKLWCAYTCAPDQRFLKLYGEATVEDPENPPNTNVVLKTTAVVDRTWACDMYQSCKDTVYVKEDAPLSNCVGFLNFQGQTEGIGHGAHIEWIFTDDPTQVRIGSDAPPLPCCNFRAPGADYNQSCPCSVCKQSCYPDCDATNVPAGQVSSANIPVLQGFNFWVVGSIYLAIIVVSSIALFFQSSKRKQAAASAHPL